MNKNVFNYHQFVKNWNIENNSKHEIVCEIIIVKENSNLILSVGETEDWEERGKECFIYKREMIEIEEIKL